MSTRPCANSDILDRFIKRAEELSKNTGQKKDSGSAPSKALNNIAETIRNDLRNEDMVLANIFYHGQIEFFNEQLDHTYTPAMSEFLAKLKSYGIQWWKKQQEVTGNTDRNMPSE